MIYEMYNLPHWSDVPYEQWRACATSKPSGGGLLRDVAFKGLVEEIGGLVDIHAEGAELVHDIAVLIGARAKEHQGQQEHAHAEWAALFYPTGADVPLCLRTEHTIERVQPAPCDLVILAPDVIHWVARNDTDQERLSFATLWLEPGRRTRFAGIAGR